MTRLLAPLAQGVVTIRVNSLAPPPSSFRPLPAQLDTFEIERAFASGQGAVVGITDFVLQRLRSFQADTNTECTVLEVQRRALEVMVAEVPAVATALQVSYKSNSHWEGGWFERYPHQFCGWCLFSTCHHLRVAAVAVDDSLCCSPTCIA
jgi:hypothetical protein